MRKRAIILLTLSLLSLYSVAQSDFEIAQAFMSKKGVTLINDVGMTRGNAETYSIFNGEDGKGFAIVVNGIVIGYSTENKLDKDNMPCGLKGMLGTYSERASTRGDYPVWWTPRNVTSIEPLIKTHWTQSSPYNDLLERKNGFCVTVANGQILHYYRIKECKDVEIWGQKGGSSDIVYLFSLPYTTFNHDLILDEYDETSSEESKEEIAKFMKYVELTIGSSWTDFQTALDVTCKSYTADKNYYDTFKDRKYSYTNVCDGYLESVYNFLDENLGNGVPLRVNLYREHEGHALILDGRDNEGRYHLNWGWGGLADGYYAISDNGDSSELGYGFSFGDLFIVIKPKSWTTAINSVETKKSCDGKVYNLQGQKVGDTLEGLPKGVYIKDGKKQVVK